MKKMKGTIVFVVLLLMFSLQQQAQVLEVSVINVGGNKIQIIGVPTAPGFTTSPANAWATMNLSWRIPKSAAIPAPTVAPPAATPQIVSEATAFTGAAPGNAFNGQMDLSMFDLTLFGLPDDNYWYFQVTGTAETVQNMVTGSANVLYEFTAPYQWLCPACVELLLTDIPGLPISTTSYIDNAGLGVDVLQLAINNAPLPVKFISFDARKDQQQVRLNWRVSDEENIRTYHVERSADGINYTSIGVVDPKPFALTNDYAFTDAAPLSPINFYRIREEDLNGTAVYSIVRIVRMEGPSFIVSLYPVPVKDELTLKLSTTANEPASIRVTDVLGRIVLLRNVQLNAGENIRKIPVHEWKNGTYFIEVTGTGKQWAGKFVKE
jgi:hypothetical protein